MTSELYIHAFRSIVVRCESISFENKTDARGAEGEDIFRFTKTRTSNVRERAHHLLKTEGVDSPLRYGRWFQN